MVQKGSIRGGLYAPYNENKAWIYLRKSRAPEQGNYCCRCRNNLSVLTEDEMTGGTMRNNRRTKRTESFV